MWKSDGTPAGTSLVKQLDWIDSSGFDAPDYMQVVNDKLMFWGDDGVHGLELWTSDGTEAGTRMVLDINPGPAGTSVFGAEYLNGILYFSAAHPVTGPELWRSDGTESGTYVVRDIDPSIPINREASPGSEILCFSQQAQPALVGSCGRLTGPKPEQFWSRI